MWSPCTSTPLHGLSISSRTPSKWCGALPAACSLLYCSRQAPVCQYYFTTGLTLVLHGVGCILVTLLPTAVCAWLPNIAVYVEKDRASIFV